MPSITLSLEEKYIAYLRKQAEDEKRDMSSVVELALEAQMKRKVKKNGDVEK